MDLFDIEASMCYTFFMRTFKRKRQQRTWDKEHRVEILNKSKARQEKNLSTWEGFLPFLCSCEVCGESIGFRNPSVPVIAFDHRYGGIEPIKSPSAWLRSNPRTIENEKLWLSCDFGILCRRCNGFLPGKNRSRFLTKAIQYCNKSG
jgi:hypothetical protein